MVGRLQLPGQIGNRAISQRRQFLSDLTYLVGRIKGIMRPVMQFTSNVHSWHRWARTTGLLVISQALSPLSYTPSLSFGNSIIS